MGRKLSDALVEKIKALSMCGMRQKDIASSLGVSRAIVCGYQKRLGVSVRNMEPLSDEMRGKIIVLLQQGFGEPHIVKALALPAHRVRAVLHQHLYARTGGEQRRESVTELELRMIRSRFRRFEKTLAAEFNVSLGWIQRTLRRRK
jgi:hypothetical protein